MHARARWGGRRCPEPAALPAGAWRTLGPALGGRLTAIVAEARGDGERILVGSPGGGLWRSDDAGESWVHAAARGLADGSVVHLEVDRSDPARLYVATYGALYATTDDGDTVERLTQVAARARAVPATMLSCNSCVQVDSDVPPIGVLFRR